MAPLAGTGGCFKTLYIPIGKIPVFAGAGSVIPLKKETDRITQKSDLILEVYPDERKEDRFSFKIINKKPACVFLNIFVGDKKPREVRISGKPVSFKIGCSRIVPGIREKKYIYIKLKTKKKNLPIFLEK